MSILKTCGMHTQQFLNNNKSFFLSPFHWVNALEMVAKDDNLEAITLLNNMHVRYQGYKYHIMKSFVSLILRQ